jgi:hypothetical protein
MDISTARTRRVYATRRIQLERICYVLLICAIQLLVRIHFMRLVRPNARVNLTNGKVYCVNQMNALVVILFMGVTGVYNGTTNGVEHLFTRLICVHKVALVTIQTRQTRAYAILGMQTLRVDYAK